MIIFSNKRFRLHTSYLPIGRKFYWHVSKVSWGKIHQIGVFPFVIFIDLFDDYNLAYGIKPGG